MSERNAARSVRCGVLLACLVLALAAPPPAWGDTIYVDINAECDEEGLPDCNGLTWCTAYKDLAWVLYAVQERNEVLVADSDGVYYHPWADPDPEAYPDPGQSFRLKAGVTLKGGYAGCGAPDPDHRDIVEHETILSGDLMEDDDDVPIDCQWDWQCENEYHHALYKCDNTGSDPGATIETAAVTEPGPDLLGLAVPSLVELAFRPRHRPTGDRDPLAQTGLPPLLAMEVAIQEAWTSEDRRGDPETHPSHVAGECTLGNSTNPLGTPTPWLRGVEGNHRQVQVPPPQAAVANVEDFPGQPRS